MRYRRGGRRGRAHGVGHDRPRASIHAAIAVRSIPVIASLGRWAARSPWHDPTLAMSHVSVMMSLQTLISPALADGLNARIGFKFGETSYVATIRDGRLDIDRTAVADCDVEFGGSPSEVAAVIHGGAPLETIEVKGDMELAKRFVTLFPLPPKIG